MKSWTSVNAAPYQSGGVPPTLFHKSYEPEPVVHRIYLKYERPAIPLDDVIRVDGGTNYDEYRFNVQLRTPIKRGARFHLHWIVIPQTTGTGTNLVTLSTPSFCPANMYQSDNTGGTVIGCEVLTAGVVFKFSHGAGDLNETGIQIPGGLQSSFPFTLRVTQSGTKLGIESFQLFATIVERDFDV